MKTPTNSTIHADFLAPSYHAVASVNYKEIIDSYSLKTWNVLKNELLTKGSDLICEDGENAYFTVDASDTAYLYIEAAWNEIACNLDSVETEE